ncbi:hypothetical protein GCM10010129_83300 [Streptomyces fumigatiscleroticus]|nr:hypothetical protein GCM10010129_83300 [Streptomyces fumigatiscleroticus]
MALSQHDLLRLMESLRTADGIELVRALAQRLGLMVGDSETEAFWTEFLRSCANAA